MSAGAPAQVAHARILLDGGERVPVVARSLGVSRSTLYRALAALPASGSV